MEKDDSLLVIKRKTMSCTVTFILNSDKMQIDAQQLCKHSLYIASFLSVSKTCERSEMREVRVMMPTWVKASTLHTYLSYVSVTRIPDPDVTQALDLLDLAILFQDQDFEQVLLQSQCFRFVSRNNVLSVLLRTEKYKHRSEHWTQLCRNTLSMASRNIYYLVTKCRNEMAGIPVPILEQVYRVALIDNFTHLNLDNEGLVKGLKDVWGCATVVEMLLVEEKKWVPDVAESSTCVLQCTTTLHGGGPVYVSEELNLKSTRLEIRMKVRADAGVLEYTLEQPVPMALWNHYVLSVSIPISENDKITDTRVVSILNGHSRNYEIRNALLTSALRSISIHVQIDPKYVLSALLSYISSHVDEPLIAETVVSLPQSHLYQLLTSPSMKVSNEDSLLYIIGKWTGTQGFLPKDLGELLTCVSWQNVSTLCLLDCCRRFRKMKDNETFREKIKEEFRYRSGVMGFTRPNVSPVKHAYKFPTSRLSMPDYHSFIEAIAQNLPELDYTPNNPPEHDPAHNTDLRQLQAKKQLCEKLKQQYRVMSQFQTPDPSPALIRIVPVYQTLLPNDGVDKPLRNKLLSSSRSVEETVKITSPEHRILPESSPEQGTSTDLEQN